MPYRPKAIMVAIEIVEGAMDRGKMVEKILTSNKDALNKVRALVHLGMDEEDADDLVEQYQIGQSQPVYYERLNFDYDD